MNKTEQRIAIAEACGWIITQNDQHPVWKSVIRGRRNGSEAQPIPDYLNDLNAMHDAEEMLTNEQRISYVSFIADSTDCDFLFATAPQRAEAFLKTLGLWKDES